MKKKEEKDAFFNEVDKYTEVFHQEIYQAFGSWYESDILGETICNESGPDYYDAQLTLYFPTYVSCSGNHFKYNENYLELARRQNDKDWANTPYVFLLGYEDNTFHPINCVKLFELLEQDKKQYNIELNYSFIDTDESRERRNINCIIKKEDFIRLINQAEEETSKKRK